MPPQSTKRAPLPAQFSNHSQRIELKVVEGPDTGSVRALLSANDSVIVGTSEDDCDLRLSDPLVSRRHVRLTWTGKWLDAEDLGSRNGSFAGESRFQRLSIGLGGIIRVGRTVIKAVPEEVALEPVALERESLGPLIGKSEAMRKLYALINQVAGADASVLIQGETGAGKELVAEELHRRSARRDAPFLVVDCGAVPEELIESMLFGHVRGAFTGAVQNHKGIFAEADGGTVFLDEIGELRLDLQPALLRVLDRGLIRPVGTSSYSNVDVRIIAATHRDLRMMIAQREFREDLYYRLSVVRLQVPPLGDRREDVS